MSRFTCLLLMLSLMISATAALAQSSAQSFDQLKSLSGVWEGKNSRGEAVKVSYRVTSSGSAVLSEISGHNADMITMFHLDGQNKLLMTHYGTDNQPRMQATTSPDGKTITFNFLDATNLASAADAHRVVIAWLDANHHTEEWNLAITAKARRSCSISTASRVL
jgi:hypothetical protein